MSPQLFAALVWCGARRHRREVPAAGRVAFVRQRRWRIPWRGTPSAAVGERPSHVVVARAQRDDDRLVVGQRTLGSGQSADIAMWIARSTMAAGGKLVCRSGKIAELVVSGGRSGGLTLLAKNGAGCDTSVTLSMLASQSGRGRNSRVCMGRPCAESSGGSSVSWKFQSPPRRKNVVEVLANGPLQLVIVHIRGTRSLNEDGAPDCDFTERRRWRRARAGKHRDRRSELDID